MVVAQAVFCDRCADVIDYAECRWIVSDGSVTAASLCDDECLGEWLGAAANATEDFSVQVTWTDTPPGDAGTEPTPSAIKRKAGT